MARRSLNRSSVPSGSPNAPVGLGYNLDIRLGPGVTQGPAQAGTSARGRS